MLNISYFNSLPWATFICFPHRGCHRLECLLSTIQTECSFSLLTLAGWIPPGRRSSASGQHETTDSWVKSLHYPVGAGLDTTCLRAAQRRMHRRWWKMNETRRMGRHLLSSTSITFARGSGYKSSGSWSHGWPLSISTTDPVALRVWVLTWAAVEGQHAALQTSLGGNVAIKLFISWVRLTDVDHTNFNCFNTLLHTNRHCSAITLWWGEVETLIIVKIAPGSWWDAVTIKYSCFFAQ